jgi:hypothetical protein
MKYLEVPYSGAARPWHLLYAIISFSLLLCVIF